jgi:predicted 3-demethylubiquinone-9 3-methyltransferase (glyoxalase superfamily)
MPTQKIVPSLWFDKEAEEAARFYASLFSNSEILEISRYPEAGQEIHGQTPDSVMTVDFSLEGYRFMALNGGPLFNFNPSISFFANRASEEEVNRLWDQLSEGGSVLMELAKYPFSERYGWLADRYGLSWQITVAEDGASPIVPSLMFVGERAGRAEEAINFYTSLFKDSKVGDLFRYTAGQEPEKEGAIAYGPFTLAGQDFAAMDSAQDHRFDFNEAISFVVECEDQAEVDYFWERMSAVPESEQCGWLKDKFGVSWQIVPTAMNKLLTDPDPGRANRAMDAMLQMKKLDLAALRAAAGAA